MLPQSRVKHNPSGSRRATSGGLASAVSKVFKRQRTRMNADADREKSEPRYLGCYKIEVRAPINSLRVAAG